MEKGRKPHSRRAFLTHATGGAGLMLAGCASGPARGGGMGGNGETGEVEVGAAEDLMREHGVLDRLLLVYEECLRRLSEGEAPPPALAEAARLLRAFVEEYHEGLEEGHIFPSFERAGRHLDLVATLREQHRAGRRLTETLLGPAADRERRAEAIRAYLRMARPHAAREDTVLFPALRAILPAGTLVELGERFEEEEHARFGAGGFGAVVVQVAQLERELGIHELTRFTPA